MINTQTFIQKRPTILQKVQSLGFTSLYACCAITDTLPDILNFLIEPKTVNDYTKKIVELENYLKNEFEVGSVRIEAYEPVAARAEICEDEEDPIYRVYHSRIKIEDIKDSVSIESQLQKRALTCEQYVRQVLPHLTSAELKIFFKSVNWKPQALVIHYAYSSIDGKYRPEPTDCTLDIKDYMLRERFDSFSDLMSDTVCILLSKELPIEVESLVQLEKLFAAFHQQKLMQNGSSSFGEVLFQGVKFSLMSDNQFSAFKTAYQALSIKTIALSHFDAPLSDHRFKAICETLLQCKALTDIILMPDFCRNLTESQSQLLGEALANSSVTHFTLEQAHHSKGEILKKLQQILPNHSGFRVTGVITNAEVFGNKSRGIFNSYDNKPFIQFLKTQKTQVKLHLQNIATCTLNTSQWQQLTTLCSLPQVNSITFYNDRLPKESTDRGYLEFNQFISQTNMQLSDKNTCIKTVASTEANLESKRMKFSYLDKK